MGDTFLGTAASQPPAPLWPPAVTLPRPALPAHPPMPTMSCMSSWRGGGGDTGDTSTQPRLGAAPAGCHPAVRSWRVPASLRKPGAFIGSARAGRRGGRVGARGRCTCHRGMEIARGCLLPKLVTRQLGGEGPLPSSSPLPPQKTLKIALPRCAPWPDPDMVEAARGREFGLWLPPPARPGGDTSSLPRGLPYRKVDPTTPPVHPAPEQSPGACRAPGVRTVKCRGQIWPRGLPGI